MKVMNKFILLFMPCHDDRRSSTQSCKTDEYKQTTTITISIFIQQTSESWWKRERESFKKNWKLFLSLFSVLMEWKTIAKCLPLSHHQQHNTTQHTKKRTIKQNFVAIKYLFPSSSNLQLRMLAKFVKFCWLGNFWRKCEKIMASTNIQNANILLVHKCMMIREENMQFSLNSTLHLYFTIHSK
jgi:hypothetical protein